MAVTNIHLRKLLMIMHAPANVRIAKLRADIRDDLAREAGTLRSGGGDFYGPFWADAKGHAVGSVDLVEATRERIASNERRRNLYPLLRDGFLLWWDQRRRWTNEPFRPIESPRARFSFPNVNAIVKVDNILAVRDARNQDHMVYPYFAPIPALSEDAARHGLWLLTNALPRIPADELRMLDVIRGQTHAIGRPKMRGTEEQEFRVLYQNLILQEEHLRSEYD